MNAFQCHSGVKSMGWISPQQLYDDPKLWLSVDHSFHEVLMNLMKKMFPDFEEKLKNIGCHCFECEGKPLIPVANAEGKGLITGYVEKPEKLLNIRKV